MSRKFILVFLVGLFLVACAQVPKESVELSATLGRDIASVHKSHRELAQLLFARMNKDINRFVDQVYAPYQIRRAMVRQNELARSSSSEDQEKSILLAINAAFNPGASLELQDNVLKGMGIMVKKIRADVESMRHELLDPLKAQEAEVIGSIDRAYHQLHYANSIVTGHLSSVVKVHETQSEIMKAIGVERDLRKEVGDNLAKASDQIGALVETAEKVDARLNNVEENALKLKKAVSDLKKDLEKS